MEPWPPVILGIGPREAEAALSDARRRAQEAGVPGADRLDFDVAPLQADDGSKIILKGVDEQQAKTLWEHHLAPTVRSRLGQ